MNRDRESLERLLDSSLSGDDLWQETVQWINGADANTVERALDALNLLLANLDDDLRRAPSEWVRRVVSGASCPALHLARSIHSRNRDRRHRSGIGDDGLARLAASAELGAIRRLKLFFCGISDRGLRALAGSSAAGNLEFFNLVHNRVSGKGAVALLASDRLRALSELYLGRNPIDDKGAISIAECPGASRLCVLSLPETQITSRGKDALLGSPFLTDCTVQM